MVQEGPDGARWAGASHQPDAELQVDLRNPGDRWRQHSYRELRFS